MHPIYLDELKQIELGLLTLFHDYCEIKGFRYLMSYGTLLGAVRHKGFIPWDDDIDVAMPRKDYEKFFTSFPNDKPSEYARLVSYRDRSSIYPFFKLVDTRTEVIEDYVDPRYKSGIWIDIFPIDGLPSHDLPFKTNRKIKTKYNYSIGNTSKGTTKVRMVTKRLLTPLLKSSDIYREATRLDELGASTPISENGDIGVVVWGDGIQERMPYSFLEATKLAFEGKEFYATAHYDEYLRRIYGDYQKLPPVKDRKPHAIHATWLAD